MTVRRAFLPGTDVGSNAGEGMTPLIIAHRGAAKGDDQNTLASFVRAQELGVDMIEFDVRRTADGEFVIHHDARVQGRLIAEMTTKEVRALDRPGRGVPTLDDVLRVISRRVGLDIELKEAGYEREVVQRVLEFRAPHEFTITSFDDRSVCAVRASFPDARTGLIVGVRNLSFADRLREVFPIRRVRACWANCIVPHSRLLRLGYLGRMARAGVPVCVWTVNDEAELVRFMADTRVHAIVTDEPELALRLRDSMHAASRASR